MVTMATSAEQFLKAHYSVDDLDADLVRADCEHWERVMGDPVRFPKADLEFIDAFCDAAVEWLPSA
jgi:hypothetical protein